MTYELVTMVEPEFDYKEMIERRIAEEYERAGYSKPGADGSIPDDSKMKARAFDIVSRAVVTSKDDRAKKALTNGELYAAVFTEGPGAKPNSAEGLDEFEKDVMLALHRKVWGLTTPTPKGHIQKYLGDTPLVLCRGPVLRRNDYIPGVYVTADPTLILSDSLSPQIEKWVRVANDLRTHATMITDRQPELAGRVAAALNAGITRARAAAQLPAAQLTIGNGNGRKPVETDQD
jgi:hypothetical protein